MLHDLKLVRTYLTYHVLGTSTADIFISNDRSLYALIYLGCQNEKFLPTFGPEPTTLRFEVWYSTDWAWWRKLYYIQTIFIHTGTSDTNVYIV